MLTALVKMANNYASIRPQILAVLDKVIRKSNFKGAFSNMFNSIVTILIWNRNKGLVNILQFKALAMK